MKTYHVTKNDKTGKWQAKVAKGNRATMTHESKDELQKRFIAWVNKKATVKNPISIRFHGLDGKVKEERTYPRAADPRGSKG